MPTFTRPDVLSQDIANKVHDFDSDVFKWVFSNTAPVLGSTFLYSNIIEIANGNGYTTGGLTSTLTFSRTGQVTTVSGTTVVLTATGAVGPFRYLILVNTTPTTPLKPVVGWLDHGSPITMANTDTYTIPSGSLFTIG
jgi:hypothetical protein